MLARLPKNLPGGVSLILPFLFICFSFSPVLSQGIEAEVDTLDPAVPDSELVVAAPVTSLIASDYKYDNGEVIELSWVPSIDDQLVGGNVIGYSLYRSENDGEPTLIAELLPGVNNYTDEGLSRLSTYRYTILTLTVNHETPSTMTAPITPEREWINFDKK